jgi:hypothetical protein
MAKGVADNVIRIPCKASDNFFRHWFQFLTPFHHLTDREMEVAACLVKHRYELSKVILDNDLLDKVVMNEDTKAKVREECEISLAHFQVIMGKLKKNKVIINNRINPKYVPNVNNDNHFRLMFLFEFL